MAMTAWLCDFWQFLTCQGHEDDSDEEESVVCATEEERAPPISSTPERWQARLPAIQEIETEEDLPSPCYVRGEQFTVRLLNKKDARLGLQLDIYEHYCLVMEVFPDSQIAAWNCWAGENSFQLVEGFQKLVCVNGIAGSGKQVAHALQNAMKVNGLLEMTFDKSYGLDLDIKIGWIGGSWLR